MVLLELEEWPAKGVPCKGALRGRRQIRKYRANQVQIYWERFICGREVVGDRQQKWGYFLEKRSATRLRTDQDVLCRWKLALLCFD